MRAGPWIEAPAPADPMSVSTRLASNARYHADDMPCVTVADILSPREREIAEMVACGLSNKGIALRLGISHWTVSTHLRRVFAKLDINGRVELCRLVTTCWAPMPS